MWRELGDRMRGARHLELFAGIAVAALIALLLLHPGVGQHIGVAPKTELENRLERILSELDGAGNVSVMIHQNEDGEIIGVVVVDDHLDDAGTYLSLQGAVQTLLDVDLRQIRIVGSDGRWGGIE